MSSNTKKDEEDDFIPEDPDRHSLDDDGFPEDEGEEE